MKFIGQTATHLQVFGMGLKARRLWGDLHEWNKSVAEDFVTNRKSYQCPWWCHKVVCFHHTLSNKPTNRIKRLTSLFLGSWLKGWYRLYYWGIMECTVSVKRRKRQELWKVFNLWNSTQNEDISFIQFVEKNNMEYKNTVEITYNVSYCI